MKRNISKFKTISKFKFSRKTKFTDFLCWYSLVINSHMTAFLGKNPHLMSLIHSNMTNSKCLNTMNCFVFLYSCLYASLVLRYRDWWVFQKASNQTYKNKMSLDLKLQNHFRKLLCFIASTANQCHWFLCGSWLNLWIRWSKQNV